MRACPAVPLALGLAFFCTMGSAAPPDLPLIAPSEPEEAPVPPEKGINFTVEGNFTAQRRPRIVVLGFDDTNKEADSAGLSAAVEAMLITFLKRKSQFVVVDRKNLEGLFREKERISRGLVDIDPNDEKQKLLLEKIDVYIIGNVTLLAAGNQAEGGQRVEIDIRLFSLFNGRIIAAVQRSGSTTCLRSIVERLGVALEQDYLRPYYGTLRVQLDQPEQVRVLLTPILMKNALDEEKPAVELGATIAMGAERDRVEAWVMDPTTYTIRNLLSGWYLLRLERPGYEAEASKPEQFEAREAGEEVRIFDLATGLSIEESDPLVQRFVVQVSALKAETLNLNSRGFKFTKHLGTIAPRVKRQYLDTEFSSRPKRVLLFGGQKLELNSAPPAQEYTEDSSCDLFDETAMSLSRYGRTVVSSGEAFDAEGFSGGDLIIEDYQEGTLLPAGEYRMFLWEPNYRLSESTVRVRHGHLGQSIPVAISRLTAPLLVQTTGPQEDGSITIEGGETKFLYSERMPRLVSNSILQLPVDTYETRTDISGLQHWSTRTHLGAHPDLNTPPVWNPLSSVEEPRLKPQPEIEESKAPPSTKVLAKTRMVVGGRTSLLSDHQQLAASDAHHDSLLSGALSQLLHGAQRKPRLIHQAAEQSQQGPRERTPSTPNDSGESDVRVGQEPPASNNVPEINLPTQHEPPLNMPRSALSKEPESPLELLASNLPHVDLLLLDSSDMNALRTAPEVANLIREYLGNGGSLFAYVSSRGRYDSILGVPFSIEKIGEATTKFQLSKGSIPTKLLPSEKMMRRARVKRSRQLPQLEQDDLGPDWRVLAFTKSRRDPRIIEIGRRERGGYVALWLDEPAAFRSSSGSSSAAVEEVRRQVEDRVFDWARFLMYRRYDSSGELLQRAEAALGK